MQEQRLTQRDDPSVVAPWPHAGFWIRPIAGTIDLILLVVPFAVFVSFFGCHNGYIDSLFQPSTRHTSQRDSHSIGTNVSPHLSCFFCG